MTTNREYARRRGCSERSVRNALIESLERRLLFNINDFVLAFTSGINVLPGGDERGGIFVMRPDGSQMRQIHPALPRLRRLPHSWLDSGLKEPTE